MKEEPKTLKGRVITILPALIVAGGIWFLSSQSTLPQPKGVFGFDKLQHLVAYLVLAVTVGMGIPSAFWQARRFTAFFLVVFIASGYGVVDEIHQWFTPGRDCNVWDWIADTLGALLGAAVMTGVNAGLLDKIRTRFGAAA
ncbi:MAG: VanZ family protein [Spirochaetaceae bacterium]|jgi:VanZ family protein|nr:VanZ family protein [Spirochaetaceae bacterium]